MGRIINKKANAQQRFAKMAKYVVNSRLSFARTFILAEKLWFRSSQPRKAANRCPQYEKK
jgi:hypothetical protein